MSPVLFPFGFETSCRITILPISAVEQIDNRLLLPGRHEAYPQGVAGIRHAGFPAKVGTSGKLRARFAGGGERRTRPPFIGRGHVGYQIEQHLDLTAEKVRDHAGRTRVGHMHDVDAGKMLSIRRPCGNSSRAPDEP